MSNPTLKAVTDLIIRRAQQQGYVRPRDIRLELADAGLPEEQWKDVVALANNSLECRQGRYYHVDRLAGRQWRGPDDKQAIREAIRSLIRRHHQSEAKDDRRHEDRIEFIQPVTVETEDGTKHTLLSRDISTTGLRLIATQGFLGQKLNVALPQADDTEPRRFLVRILWTCAVADGLFENGGSFLELVN